MPACAYLFVPGDRPDRFLKALESGADQVILDLEDSVAIAAKDAARATVGRWLEANGRGRSVFIRVNNIATPWSVADQELAALPGVGGILLPRVEKADEVGSVRARLRPDQRLYVLVETVAGFIQLRAIAGQPGLNRIAFGIYDFANDAGIKGLDREVDAVRTQLVIESRWAGLPPPLDSPPLAIDDESSVEAEARRACRFGFGGKLCIHPRQIPPIRRGFRPTEEEQAWARRILAAFAAHTHGALALDGKLVDKPVVDAARAVIEASQTDSPSPTSPARR